MHACAGDWPEQPAINAATRLAAKPQVSTASDHSEQASLASLDSADAQEVRATVVRELLPLSRPCDCVQGVIQVVGHLLCGRLNTSPRLVGPKAQYPGSVVVPYACRLLCNDILQELKSSRHAQVAWPATKLEAAPSLRLLPETSAAAVDLLTMSVKAEDELAAVRAAGSGCGAVPEPVQLWRLDAAAPAPLHSSVRHCCQASTRVRGGILPSLFRTR